ncbi:guanine deaminase [Gloeophyllum trabeum ATCC 11539]|uniref:Guanine deaminase n=1 Tax=Gloeophyllum trabeum (strain ATCC 11539 / FP-39264 / Madison 617) TaxID=670483 RepID=S7QGG2_GLOTA|nr:guanine deaminase [Gloeophyllum trabeum ATCC 11539]EPQ58278.1 guanine deaminase [Gloeophyllum trabeum ATCC 11539]
MSAARTHLSSTTVFHGALVNPLDLHSYQALPHALLCVDPYGDIAWIEPHVPDALVQDVMARKGLVGDDVQVVQLKKGEFLMPGFIDTHTHAPQVPNMGAGQQYELLDWLENVTFPMESRFSDVDFARHTYKTVVRRVIDSGTTTCCYYGTLHVEATKVLADIIHEYGQRAFVGKCNMDRNSPDNYVEPSAEASVQGTKELLEHIRGLPPLTSPRPAHDTDRSQLVHPILTPRFAISCTSPLLTSLGQIAASDRSLRIQTHISENLSEIAFTKSLFPECSSYADVYDKHGLLRHNTVLAHAVHLEDEEIALLKERGCGISHCPTSNFNLRSGICKVGELLDRGIKVGLGTDVSGGFSPSILAAIQHASIASKVVSFQHQPGHAIAVPHHLFVNHSPLANKQLPIPALLHLATLGGAQVCDLQARVGSFAPGKAFDALLVSVSSAAGNPAVWGVEVDEALGIERGMGMSKEQHLERMLEAFMFCGDDRNISRVYVQGRVIGGKEWAASQP